MSVRSTNAADALVAEIGISLGSVCPWLVISEFPFKRGRLVSPPPACLHVFTGQVVDRRSVGVSYAGQASFLIPKGCPSFFTPTRI